MNEYISLPNGYKWYTYDMNDTNVCNKVSTFLKKHYIPDKRHNYRLQYSEKFLKWLFTVPGRLNICIGVESNKDIMAGFITGTIIKMQINNETMDMVEIKFMCIHTQLRKKNLAKLLIKQITRRFEKSEQFKGSEIKAIYGSELEKPELIFTGKYYHRPLNIKNLLDSDLLKMEGKIKIKDIIKEHYLPEVPTNKSFRKIEKDDIEETYNLFTSYITKYNCYPIFDLGQFTHIFYNNDQVDTYVLILDDIVVDFISYLKIPKEITKKDKTKKIINRAYLYYYTSDEETSYRLIRDLMIVAKNDGIDELIATDIMEHCDLLHDLGFMNGPNKIHCYLHGTTCKKLQNKQIGKFLF